MCTPDRGNNKRICHGNTLRGYYERYDDTKHVLSQSTVSFDIHDECENPADDFVIDSNGCDITLANADILSNLESKVAHLEPNQQKELIALFGW